MARRDDSPPISLFSFQDIITSITGIMFMVVLLLVLQILHAKAVPNAKADPSDHPPAAEISSLSVRRDSLSRQLADAKKREAELRKRVAQMRALPLDNVPKTMELLKRRIAAAEAETARLDSETAGFAVNGEKNHLSAENSGKSVKQLRHELEQAVAKTKNSRETAERLKQEIERRKKMLSYSIEGNSSKKLIIVECRGAGIIAKAADPEKPVDFRHPELSGIEARVASCSDFFRWAKKRNPRSEYFSLVITPAAFGYWELLDSELDSAGFTRGREIIPDNETTFFPELR